jgi:hypothetical protein
MAVGPDGERYPPLLLYGIFNAFGMFADKAVPHGDGELAESGVRPFHLALYKIRADHAGTTDSSGTPYFKYIQHNVLLLDYG